MSSFIKGIALFVALTCAVWIAVLWHWDATARVMNAGDIVVYLGLLPLTVFALVLMLRWAVRGAAARQAAAVSAAATTSAAAPAAAAPGDDAARRHATVQLLAAPIASPAGGAAGDLLAAAKDGQPRPSLDAELRQDDGLPVFTARLPSLDLDAGAESIEAAQAAARADRAAWSTLEVAPHVRRALTALQPVLRAATDALVPWQARFEPAPPRPGEAAVERPLPRLRVLLGLPPDWSEFDQAVALHVATAVVDAQDVVPPPRRSVAAMPGTGEDLVLQADRLMHSAARAGQGEPVLVAACHSAIGPEAVEALERAGRLFAGPQRPRGQMPGEAAAALLLAPADWPADPDADLPPPHLHRPVLVVRDKPIDAPGRTDAGCATQALGQALAAAALEPAKVAALVSDADQHTARNAELHACALAQLPHLDAAEDLRLLATVTGAPGPVGPLLAIAGAAAEAQARGQACAALTCGDAQARLALVALPAAPQPAGAARAEAPATTAGAAT